jgi:hypothetical protein
VLLPYNEFIQDVRGQFVMGRGEAARSADDASVIRLNDLDLLHFEPCPATEVIDAAGNRVGVLLGHPIDLVEQKVIRKRYLLSATVGNDIDGFVETHIHAPLGGSFLFILTHGSTRRIYLDAGGTMSAVYDPEQRRVAATTPLLLDADAYRERFDAELHAFLQVPREGWFPASLTAHHGVFRIQANHYLDLDSWQQRRHWPMAPVPQAEDPMAASQQAGIAVQSSIAAMQEADSVAVALTGGNESRLLLAVCRERVEELDFCMVDNRSQAVDHALSLELAQRFDLRHRFLPAVQATPDEQEVYLSRAGHCIGDARARNFPSVAPLADYGYFVNGVGGGVGRGFFWRGGDTATTSIDARALTTRLGMPVHPRVIEAVGRWLEGTRHFDTFLMLDLAFLELRMAPWAFANSYGMPDVRHIHPLISRSVFEAMVSLPPEWRRKGLMTTEIVNHYWPELGTVRINSFGDYRDVLQILRRVANDPTVIAKKFRRKFA